MTQILINRIRYKNFKGFTDFVLSLNGQSVVVSAKNGSGKTSLSDGLQWLFFGKDSKGLKLNPKPLDPSNYEQIGLKPEVEAELIIDGKIVTMKRVQKESWTAKRGELEKTRGSDTTKYYIDEVPKKEKEWKEFLEKLGGESRLQMLSNSSFFMQMNWKDRREILISMTGLTDEEIIANDPELQSLTQILDGRTVDEAKKMFAGQKKQVKIDIEGIPARIQENTDTINNILKDKTPEKVKEAIDFFTKEIETKELKLTTFSTGNPTLDYQQEIAQLQLKLSQENTQFLTNSNLTTQNLQEDVNAQQAKVNKLRADLQEQKSKLYQLEQAIQEKQAFRAAKLSEYKALEVSTFDDHQTVCPTCNQDLPLDQVEGLKAKFNQGKAEKLEANMQAVKSQQATKQDMANLASKLKETQVEINRLESELAASSSQLDLINNDLNFQRTKIGTFEQSDKYKEINQQIIQCEQKIKNASNDKSGEEQSLRQAIAEDKNNLAVMQATLKEFDYIKEIEERIAELKDQDKELKKQNQAIEKNLWLLDEFTRRKVKKLEESINNKFQIVKWKLFDVLKNGAIAEECEATYHGVGYQSGLSDGEKGLVDIDIVKSLFVGHKIELPIFMDNDERITEQYEVPGQLIKLRAVPGLNELKVEV